MKPYFNLIVPGQLWHGRPSEKVLRNAIVGRLEVHACNAAELSQYMGWPEKLLKPHLKALQKKGRIENLNGMLYTRKTPLGANLAAVIENLYLSQAQQAHKYNEKNRRIQYSPSSKPKIYKGSESGS